MTAQGLWYRRSTFATQTEALCLLSLGGRWAPSLKRSGHVQSRVLAASRANCKTHLGQIVE
jgi:hypothetical protein